MFWRVTTFTPLSPIEAILDKDEISLDELLNEEDIIQECKSANSRLVQYLGNPKVLDQLLWYLTETPEDDLHFKYSYTACEIFCCELDDVLSALISSDELMERLFSPLNKPPPLNSTLAGYFGRVVGCLLVKRAADTQKWLAAHPLVLPALVRHVDTTSTVEVILRLVGADDAATMTGTAPGAAEWLSETNLMDQLLETLMAPKERSARAARIQRAAQQNIGDILVHIARNQSAPMIHQLTMPAYLSRMLEAAAAPESEVLQPVLKVAIALLSPRPTIPVISVPQIALGLMTSHDQPVEPNRETIHAAALELVRFIPHFAAMLARPAPTAAETQELPYGILKPPLGRQRITIIELGQALLATFESSVVRAMLDSEFIPRAMDLFQHYPFNSILHSHVLDMLGTLIDALTPANIGPCMGSVEAPMISGSPAVDSSDLLPNTVGNSGQEAASLRVSSDASEASGDALSEDCNAVAESLSSSHSADGIDAESAEVNDMIPASPPGLPSASMRNIVRPGLIGSSVAGTPGTGLPPAGVAVGESAEGPESNVPGVHVGGRSLDDIDDDDVDDDVPILDCLLEKVDIIGWLLKLNDTEEASRTYFQPHKESSKEEPLRAAYHGHITQLAAKLQSSKHGLLQATLDMKREWQTFKTGYLDKQLLLEDRTSWEVDMPVEQTPGDDLVEIPGCCQMDVYSQEFERSELLQNEMFNGIPVAGRYTVDDEDDDYADSSMPGLFQGVHGSEAAQGHQGNTIDADGGRLGNNRNSAEQAAAVQSVGLADSMIGNLQGGGDRIGASGLTDQMSGLGFVDAPTVDDDDEVVTGGGEEYPPAAVGEDASSAAAALSDQAAEVVEEEEPLEAASGSSLDIQDAGGPAGGEGEADESSSSAPASVEGADLPACTIAGVKNAAEVAEKAAANDVSSGEDEVDPVCVEQQTDGGKSDKPLNSCSPAGGGGG